MIMVFVLYHCHAFTCDVQYSSYLGPFLVLVHISSRGKRPTDKIVCDTLAIYRISGHQYRDLRIGRVVRVF